MVRRRTVLAALALPWKAEAQASTEHQATLPRLEAAYLRNFARYVGWPAESLPGAGTPWSICVVGPLPAVAGFAESFEGRVERGHAFNVVLSPTPRQLQTCQIVLVRLEAASERQALLASLRGRPVLTVGEAESFMAEGGIVRLTAGEFLDIGINLDQARVASLDIPTKLLEVTRVVVDGGVTRRLK